MERESTEYASIFKMLPYTLHLISGQYQETPDTRESIKCLKNIITSIVIAMALSFT